MFQTKVTATSCEKGFNISIDVEIDESSILDHQDYSLRERLYKYLFGTGSSTLHFTDGRKITFPKKERVRTIKKSDIVTITEAREIVKGIKEEVNGLKKELTEMWEKREFFYISEKF